MQGTKGLLFGVALLVVLGLAGVAIGITQPALHPSAAQPTLVPYLGNSPLTFSYPNTYTLTERGDSFEGQPIRVLTFVNSGVSVPDESDGPPAISIIIVPNPKNVPLSQWVKEKSISDFSLSPDQTLSTTVLAGEP